MERRSNVSTRLIACSSPSPCLRSPGGGRQGTDDDHDLRPGRLSRDARPQRLDALPVGGAATNPPKAAFFRVTVHMRADRPVSFRMYFLPREGLLREQPMYGSWMRAEPAQAAAL